MAQLDILVGIAGLNQALAGLGQLRTAMRGISRDPNAPPAIANLAGKLEPVVSAFQLATRGMALFAAAVEMGTQALITMTNAAVTTGGTGRDIAFLSGLGIDPNRSAAFRSNLASDPFARYAAMKVGVSPQQMLPPQLGTQNFASGMRQALEGLRNIQDAEEQLRLARMLGVEQELPLLHASQKEWDKLVESVGRLQAIAEPQTQAIIDLQASWQTLTNDFKALMMGVVGGLTPAIKGLIDMVDEMVKSFMFAAMVMGMQADALQKIFTGNIGEGFRELQETMDPGLLRQVWDSVQAAAAAMNNSAQAQNNAANAMQRGASGGGQRFRDAVTGGFLNPNMDGWAFRAGAFGY